MSGRRLPPCRLRAGPVLLLCAALLAGCGAQPTPAMFGAERTEVVRGGRHYVVFLKDRRVEVIRLGYARSGEHRGIRATMIALIPEVTGCKLVAGSLRGDSGEMRGQVWCPAPGSAATLARTKI